MALAPSAAGGLMRLGLCLIAAKALTLADLWLDGPTSSRLGLRLPTLA